ncbi:MAG: hypothetical protein WA973_21900 [Mesorhizobium sp.]
MTGFAPAQAPAQHEGMKEETTRPRLAYTSLARRGSKKDPASAEPGAPRRHAPAFPCAGTEIVRGSNHRHRFETRTVRKGSIFEASDRFEVRTVSPCRIRDCFDIRTAGIVSDFEPSSLRDPKHCRPATGGFRD